MKVSSNKSKKSQKPAARKKKTAKPAKKVASSGGRKAGIAVAIVLFVIVAALAGIGAYANTVELIYPNVSLEGVDLSGMTITEAADVLGRGSFADGEDKELSVSLPADVELVISAKDAGLFLTAPDAAVFVYNYCHGGGFFGNTITYFECAFGGAELLLSDGTALNEEYLRGAVEDGVRQTQLALLESSLEIGEESITVIKGAASAQIDGEELYELVKLALEESRFEPMEYAAVSASGSSEELDLEKLYDTVFIEPVNAVYDSETKSATESVNGRSFDIEEAQKLWDAASIGEKVVIPLVITEPEISTERLDSMLFSEVLAQKSTSLSGSSYARVNNIKKASEAINGLVLNPGEEFSYNGVVGQRTAAGGYMSAGAYNNGQVVSEVGGGICQVSSTLYYCALMSNLEITNRLCHMFGVDYLPSGLDATVSWPEPDFKFKNSSDYPIRIEAYVDSANNTCVIKIYGSNPDGIRVEMTTEQYSYADGYGATSYRWVYDRDGNLISKAKEADSRYYYKKAAEEPEASASPSPSPGESPGTSDTPTDPGTQEPTPTVPADTPPPQTPDPVTPVDPGGETEGG